MVVPTSTTLRFYSNVSLHKRVGPFGDLRTPDNSRLTCNEPGERDPRAHPSVFGDSFDHNRVDKLGTVKSGDEGDGEPDLEGTSLSDGGWSIARVVRLQSHRSTSPPRLLSPSVFFLSDTDLVSTTSVGVSSCQWTTGVCRTTPFKKKRGYPHYQPLHRSLSDCRHEWDRGTVCNLFSSYLYS